MFEPVVELPGIELDPVYVHQAVAAALHTILFCRLLGALTPVDAVADQFGLTYATVGDPAVLATVASKAASVAAWADRHRGKRAAVRLSLFEGGGKAATTAATTTTTTTTAAAAAAAAAPWETWVLPLAVSPSPTNPSTSSLRCEEQQLGTSPTVSASPTTTAALPLGKGRPGLEAILLAAASAASSRRECVPPVLTPAVATFPFAIDLLPEPIAKAGGGSFGLGAVKRLLLQASPPSVLG